LAEFFGSSWRIADNQSQKIFFDRGHGQYDRFLLATRRMPSEMTGNASFPLLFSGLSL
jgi:hypothetical protein